jgi:hypothetical protein
MKKIIPMIIAAVSWTVLIILLGISVTAIGSAAIITSPIWVPGMAFTKFRKPIINWWGKQVRIGTVELERLFQKKTAPNAQV